MPDDIQLARLDSAILAVDEAGKAAALGSGSSHIAFGWPGSFSEEWQSLVRRVDDLLRRLLRRCVQLTRVETEQAITVVTFRSDIDSVFAFAPTLESARLHFESLEASLEYKKKLGRLLIAATQATVSIVSAASFPPKVPSAMFSCKQLAQALESVLSVEMPREAT